MSLEHIIQKISINLLWLEWSVFSNVSFLALWSLLTASIPKLDPKQLCDAWKLCSVREKNWEYMVWVKYLDWSQAQISLRDIVDADKYLWLQIIRTYSSWHVFLNEDCNKVYLLTTEKNWIQQAQFTGWSPLEEIYSEIVYNSSEWKTKVDIYKVEDNAIQRTLIRTWVEVTDVYNEMPLVDRVLIERIDDIGEKYWRLVLLMHRVVKDYIGTLWYLRKEQVIDGKRYPIDDLPNLPNIAANAYIVSNKARGIINKTKA